MRHLLHGVYAPVTAADDAFTRAAAVRLLIPARLHAAGGAVAEAAAAWVLAGGPEPARVDVYLPPGGTRRGEGCVVVHQARLRPGDLDTSAGLLHTTAVRTAADIARRLPPEEATVLLDRLRSVAGALPAAVLARLEQMPRARGVPQARGLCLSWATGGGPAAGPVSPSAGR